MSEKVRSFELRVYNDSKTELLDKFMLDLVTSPSGLGFTQDVTVISSETVDYIVNRAIKKQDIKITVEFEEPDSYNKVNSLRSWIAKHIKDKMVLYYNDTTKERLMDVYIKDFQLTEIVTSYNSIPLTITPLSPFYLLGTQKTTVSKTGTSKSYPYSYPHSYGGTQLVNNELDNSFFTNIPLLVKIYGKITNPRILLKDPSNNTYSQVNFPTLVVAKNQSLLIDAVNSRIIFDNGNSELDYYDYLDKTHDSFLFAKSGKTIIDANFSSDDDGYIEIYYTQYTL